MTEPEKKQQIALGVDVEDYFMSPESIPVTDWDQYEDRIAIGTNRLLHLFQELGLRTTFFFLGYVAEKHPDLVQAAHRDGHEIAVHTYDHQSFRDLSPEDRRSSLERSMKTVQDITGEPVRGIRAPQFSIHSTDREIHRELVDLGLEYDSSVNPFRTYLYGEKTRKRRPYLIEFDEKHLVELPVATVNICGKAIAAGGGFYLRALPSWYFRWAFRRINREGLRAVLYIHPWEYDPDHPDLPIRGKERWIHNRGLHGMYEKTRALLAQCESIPLLEYARQIRNRLEME